MSNFAARNLTMGQMNALVKKLGGEATVLALLAGTLKFTLVPVEGQLYNGSVFFQTRDGLWVDSNLERYVGLDGHIIRGTLPTGRMLEHNTSEDYSFGKVGSDQYAATLANVVDLGQIQALIEAQWGGASGTLLTKGYANLFPVKGKDGTLHVVNVYWRRDHRAWYIYCHPFCAAYVSYAGYRVFSN